MDGIQKEKLNAAFLDEFAYNDLERLLRFRLNKRLHLYVATGDEFRHTVFRLIESAEKEGWLLSLMVQASQYHPHSAALLQILQECEIAPVPRTEVSDSYAPFERMVEKLNPSFDLLPWIAQAGQAFRCVCFISLRYKNITQSSSGTGFLVGPDSVLTNYHVIEPLLEGDALADEVRVRFDYCMTPNGRTIFTGVEYALMSGDRWLIDHSPYDPADSSTAPTSSPLPENLDYALLRLNKKAGDAPVGRLEATPSGADGPPRGWLMLPQQAFDWAKNSSMPLLILQHPKGAPLKLAFSSNAQIVPNENGTRVRYGVNTDNGSSGSPCFTKDWEPIALHHAGDPDYTQMARYNQGIPLYAIAERIRRTEDGKNAISQPAPTGAG